MKYLMDTCSFIWYIQESPKLSSSARELVNNSYNIYLSYVTLWEIAIKQSVGKLDTITMTVFELAEVCRENGIILIPIQLAHLERIKKLPLIHRDPFDRIIMATAIEENCTLITNDSEIIKYDGIKTFWENT